MRLVDAKELEKQIKEAFKENPVVMGMLLRWIRKQPIIDAVPVVRCKDCYLHGECMTEDAFHWSGIQNPYCAAGKKTDDERNALLEQV